MTAASIDRRQMLAGSAASMAGAGLGPIPALGQQLPSVHAFKLGGASVTVLSDGSMAMPLGFVLPDRRRDDVAVAYREASRTLGELSLQVNVTLIRMGAETILVDAGSGPDFAPQRGKLADNLTKAGVKPEDVTRVIFTHAHPDHLWGVIDPLDGGTMFPNARHYMTAVERDYWLKPGMESGVPEAARGSAIGTQRRLKELGARIESVKAGAEILPGVSLIDTAGHTPGHVAVLVDGGGARLMVGGDALTEPVISFGRFDWRWAPDQDPDRAIASRKRLLDMLVAEKIPLVGYHLPWPGLGRVERAAGGAAGYRFVQD
jgi:glyoxylase-like metal-dependent hydrolase (beta-lactamase superfamily II)